ncbi:MAG: hypothetical protein GKR89_37025 [Candidatus Latescibacteria bacterium]|nr:hypothetical protein [Candidatus Latescibacterota bacterium]
MLTPAQIAHYETFGFLILRRILTPAEIAEITGEANQIWRDDQERQPDENPYQIVVPFVEKRPGLAQLPEDDRIYRPIVDLLGPDFVWGGSEGHKGSFTEENLLQWHSDRPDDIGVQYARVKVMIYLQPMQKKTGALRIIPGSHHLPFLQHLRALHEGLNGTAQNDTSLRTFGVAGPDLYCQPLEVQPGDVVMFNDRLFHAVYGKQEGRSFITVKYVKFAAEPTTEKHFEILRADDGGFGLLHEAFRGSQRPRIRDMVGKLRGWEEKLGH